MFLFLYESMSSEKAKIHYTSFPVTSP